MLLCTYSKYKSAVTQQYIAAGTPAAHSMAAFLNLAAMQSCCTCHAVSASFTVFHMMCFNICAHAKNRKCPCMHNGSLHALLASDIVLSMDHLLTRRAPNSQSVSKATSPGQEVEFYCVGHTTVLASGADSSNAVMQNGKVRYLDINTI